LDCRVPGKASVAVTFPPAEPYSYRVGIPCFPKSDELVRSAGLDDLPRGKAIFSVTAAAGTPWRLQVVQEPVG
jgi:hypothetical protein